jgi:hypothetical protein
MKEKKHLKMAEKRCVASARGQTQAHTLMLRAAKKLARRRWDPPPAAERRRYVSVQYMLTVLNTYTLLILPDRLEQKLGDFSEVLDLNLSPDGDRFLPTHECVFRWDRVSTNNYVPSDVLEMFIESIYEPSQRYVYPERTLD